MLRWVALSLLVVLVTAGLATIAQSQDGETQAIRRVIENLSRAINDADLPLLLDQIADDAVIDSRVARGRVNKQKYADAMMGAFKTHEIISFATRDIKITMVDATRATVRGTIHSMNLVRRFVYDHEWKLEKRDGFWLIVETAYRTQPSEPVKPLEIA
jgi:ketosteroid isomerase-like protein